MTLGRMSKPLPQLSETAGWTAEEYARCPEVIDRLHRRILDLQDALDEVTNRLPERERLAASKGCPGNHGSACCGYPAVCAETLRGEDPFHV